MSKCAVTTVVLYIQAEVAIDFFIVRLTNMLVKNLSYSIFTRHYGTKKYYVPISRFMISSWHMRSLNLLYFNTQ